MGNSGKAIGNSGKSNNLCPKYKPPLSEFLNFNFNFNFSISIYFHISQVNLHITEIRYNKIITCFECTSQNNFLTQDINGQSEYNVDLPKVASNMMGPT